MWVPEVDFSPLKALACACQRHRPGSGGPEQGSRVDTVGLAEAKALSLHVSMLGDATFTDRAWRRKPDLGVRALLS